MSLIACPECSHTISDRAYSCPYCGFPVRDRQTDFPYGRKRLPNGFGCIKHLSGKRSKPFAVYPSVQSLPVGSSPGNRAAIGYYHDWYEAYEALRSYKETGGKSSPATLTFQNVYEGYMKEKFRSDGKAYSKSTRQAYESAFQNCKELHEQRFLMLKKADLQSTLDHCTLGYSSHCNIKKLYDQLYKYALENDIVEKNYSLFVSIHKENDNEKGEPFSPKELSVLWKNTEHPDVPMILIMIYSGFRIKAFETIHINLTERYFQGGVKTKSAKDRIVPIHPSIFSFTKKMATLGNNFNSARFRKEHFYKTLSELGILFTENGKKHTPHDCRHTFSWLCDHYQVDDLSKHLLMGHSLGKDIEKTVYGHRTLKELTQEIAKIRIESEE